MLLRLVSVNGPRLDDWRSAAAERIVRRNEESGFRLGAVARGGGAEERDVR